MTNIFFTSALSALGWTVVHSLWQGTILAALLAVFLTFSRGRKPQLRYLASVSTLVAWSMMTVVTFLIMWPETKAGGEDSEFAQYVFGDMFLANQSTSWWTILAQTLESNSIWIGIAWCLGCLLVAARWMGGQWYLNRIRTEYSRPVVGQWKHTMLDMADQIGLRRTIELLESSKVHAPILVGALRPAILLPIGILSGMDPRQIEAILAHELAHIRRWDDVVNVLLAFWESLWFYHPAYWWISGRVKQERELCCDDMAVQLCGDPLMYAKTLAHLEARRGPVPAAALAMQGNEGPLFQRIQRIMMPHTKSPYSWPRFLPAGLAVAAFLIIGWVSPTALTADNDNEPMLLGPITIGNDGESLVPQFEEQQEPIRASRSMITPVQDLTDESTQNAVFSMERFPWQPLVACLDSPKPAPPMPPMPAMPPMPEMPAMPAMPVMPDMSDMPQPPTEWTDENKAAYEEAMEEWGERFGEQMEQKFSPEWEEQMEAWGEKMEEWGEQYAASWEDSPEFEQWEEDFEEWAEEWAEKWEEGSYDEEDVREFEQELNQRLREQERRRDRNIERNDQGLQRSMEMQQRAIERQREMMARNQQQVQRRLEEAHRMQEEAHRRMEQQQRQVAILARSRAGHSRDMEDITERYHAFSRDSREDFGDHLREELVNDGLMRENASKIKIKTDGEQLKINGTQLEDRLYDKYRRILSGNGISFCDDCSSTMTIDLD